MPYALALLASALYGVGDFLGGVATRRAPLLAVTWTSQAVGLVGLAILVPLTSNTPPALQDLAWGAGAGLGGGVGLALLYYGLAVGEASVVAPVTAVCSIAIPVLVDLLGGEAAPPRVVAGILIAMAAVAMLSRGGHEPETATRRVRPRVSRMRAVLIAIASGVAIGAFLTCLGVTRAEAGMWPLLAARVVSVTGFAIACLVTRSAPVPPRTALGATLAAGAVDVVSNAIYVAAVRQGALGPIATLASLYPASTVALARIVWHERLRAPQWWGVALALVAIAMITWKTG